MAIASSQQTFLTNALTSTHKPQHKILNPTTTRISCICSMNNDHELPSKKQQQITKLAMVTLAAGILTLGSVDGALAAKSGGRVGGQAFRSSAPRPSSPRVNNSRTNIYINPPVAPPLGGYGYGVPYGGWGWSPFSFFAPGPSVAVGVGGGFDLLPLFLFMGAAAAVIRSFRGRRDEDDDDY
ncbi:hypothetical protein AQUCO_02400112v1 [Aquilegia coerulea]|uniref:Transmembrane protein n=1 Tax=Aquilegia coerulea TaxID=218851 RepID=A0A2G5DBG6_AQUCA|nr:hypothetical protein AQUCO_02400112v1 [Aquilegia coerulea]